MDNIFIVVKDGFVKNRIVAESFEAAEEFCGPGNIFIETDETGPAYIDGRWDGTKFYPVNPDDMPVKQDSIDE